MQPYIDPIVAGVSLAKEHVDVVSWAESSKVLMRALDDLGKIHPFVTGALEYYVVHLALPLLMVLLHKVAVLAFKAVVTLELKRRENDKKVIALNMLMKDMLSTLLLYDSISSNRLISKVSLISTCQD